MEMLLKNSIKINTRGNKYIIAKNFIKNFTIIFFNVESIAFKIFVITINLFRL